MTEISERYRRLSDDFAATIAGVPEDRWPSPSPCEDWTAREVVGHVVGTQGMFLGLIGEEMGEIPSVDDDPDWRRWPRRPAPTEFDGFSAAAAIDRFLNTDLVIHRWDLARATGQDVTIDPADAERVLEVAREFGDEFRSPGVCGPEVPVGDDADLQTRTLAFFGRRASRALTAPARARGTSSPTVRNGRHRSPRAATCCGGRGRPGAERELEPTPQPEVVDRQHVGTTQVRDQEHLRAPPPDAAHLRQLLDDGVVVEAPDLAERRAAGRRPHAARGRACASTFAPRQARAPQLLVGGAQDVGRGEPAPRPGEQVTDAAVDRRRRLDAELLVDDRLGQASRRRSASGASSRVKGPIRSINRASFGSDARRKSTAALRSNGKPVSPSTVRTPFDREHAQLGRHATRRREPARLPARGEHPMTRHDDRVRVAAERLADGARRAGRPDRRRHLAVRHGLARRDGPHHLVHLALEGRQRREVERDVDQVVGLAPQATPRCCRSPTCTGGGGVPARVPSKRSRRRAPRVGHPRFGQLHADDHVAVPRDPTPSDRRVEEGERAHATQNSLPSTSRSVVHRVPYSSYSPTLVAPRPEQPRDLRLPVVGVEVEVRAVLHRLALGHLDEEPAGLGPGRAIPIDTKNSLAPVVDRAGRAPRTRTPPRVRGRRSRG